MNGFERYVYWDEEDGEPWEGFVDRGVGEFMNIEPRDGQTFRAVVTTVDNKNRRVGFRKVAGEA